jgi:hypothetical protein
MRFIQIIVKYAKFTNENTYQVIEIPCAQIPRVLLKHPSSKLSCLQDYRYVLVRRLYLWDIVEFFSIEFFLSLLDLVFEVKSSWRSVRERDDI